MSDVCINIDIVPQSNDDEMEPMFDSQIVGTDDWIIVYTQVEEDSSGNLYKFNFLDRTWQIVCCSNLPKFVHYSMVLLHQRLLVMHGTTDEDRHVYRTYIGDLTKQSRTEFQCIASLVTPLIMQYGEQKVVTDNASLYALAGRRITGPIQTSVYRLDLETNQSEWTLLFEGSVRNFPRARNEPTAGQSIVLHRQQIFVFPREDSLDVTHLPVFDLQSNVWRRVETTHEMLFSPGFSYSRYRAGDEYALAQCPVTPQNVYLLTVEPYGSIDAWAAWRLDLDELRYTQLRVHGPPVSPPTRARDLGAVVTPSGRMYVIRAADQPTGSPGPGVGAKYLVFGTTVRVPRLEDRALEAVAELQRRVHAADPGLPNVYDQLPRSLALRFRRDDRGDRGDRGDDDDGPQEP